MSRSFFFVKLNKTEKNFYSFADLQTHILFCFANVIYIFKSLINRVNVVFIPF